MAGHCTHGSALLCTSRSRPENSDLFLMSFTSSLENLVSFTQTRVPLRAAADFLPTASWELCCWVEFKELPSDWLPCGCSCQPIGGGAGAGSSAAPRRVPPGAGGGAAVSSPSGSPSRPPEKLQGSAARGQCRLFLKPQTSTPRIIRGREK